MLDMIITKIPAYEHVLNLFKISLGCLVGHSLNSLEEVYVNSIFRYPQEI